MAIKASGSSLSFSEIRTFWGDANSGTMSLSEYYAGGNNVFSGAVDEAGNAIPSSGNPIKVSDFYSTHTVTTGGTTNFSTAGTDSFTIPLGVSTLTVTLYGAGGQGGEGDESGAGGGGGGGGSGGVVQGTLTISNNIQGNPSQQSVFVTIGDGGNASFTREPGSASSIVYNSQTTSAGGGGAGGGFSATGNLYSAGSAASNSIGSNFSASTNAAGNAPGSGNAASGDFGSAAGSAGASLASNPLSLSSSAGSGGTLASNAAASGGNASGVGAGGGGAASIDRTGDHHWFGGDGADGFVRIVVAS